MMMTMMMMMQWGGFGPLGHPIPGIFNPKMQCKPPPDLPLPPRRPKIGLFQPNPEPRSAPDSALPH